MNGEIFERVTMGTDQRQTKTAFDKFSSHCLPKRKLCAGHNLVVFHWFDIDFNNECFLLSFYYMNLAPQEQDVLSGVKKIN